MLMDPLVFTYTNHRGETAVRRVYPVGVRFGTTEWHKTPQWLLNAFCLDKGEMREFAMASIGAKVQAKPEQNSLEESAADAAKWVAEAEYFLDHNPYTIRMCEGGGPEDLHGSMAATITKMEGLLKTVAVAAERYDGADPGQATTDGRNLLIAAARNCKTPRGQGAQR
jgi:predicted DNA-binding transcriptional regulator YafY